MVVPWRFLRVLVLVVMILGVPLVGSVDSGPVVISGGVAGGGSTGSK